MAPKEPKRDAKRYWWLLSALFPGLVWLNLWSYQQGGNVAWLWFSSAVMYGLVPLLDAVLGNDVANPAPETEPVLEADRWYRALLVLFVPLQFGLTVHGAWIAVEQPQGPLGVLGWIGLVLSVGGINGVAINTAHELGHKQPLWERRLALLALAPVAYGHFHVEHNRGHHRRVATPEDPASARLGESFWAFLPRTLIGGLRSAWELERMRLAGRGLPALHWRNVCLRGWAMTAAMYGALALWLGLGVLPFLVVQAFYGISLLEVVNYIEHYGLLRGLDAKGRRVPCAPEHSWNASQRVSNLFLYQLQRHSDHHANPLRRYQILRHTDSAPQLPAGYAAMLMLAYVPPLWFAVMNKRVLEHYGGDRGRANIRISTAQRPG